MNWKPSTNSDRLRTADRDQIAVQYIHDNFAPDDRLAVVLVNKRAQDVIQRIATAENIAAKDFQAWLHHQNTIRYEIYLSMNALALTARGRTKVDVETIRHIYLDFDYDGTATVEKLLAREDVPPPNYLIHTSPDKWQVVWKVREFGKQEAEQLQQGLVHELDADPAATDCSRVLRLPGFYNHKYSEPFWIASQTHAQETYGPERFPRFRDEGRAARSTIVRPDKLREPRSDKKTSQSERDWAYAKRALHRGEPEASVIAAIASHRRFEKHNPQYYAELTVRKAAERVRAERMGRSDAGQPER